jgi:hypothetical protein
VLFLEEPVYESTDAPQLRQTEALAAFPLLFRSCPHGTGADEAEAMQAALLRGAARLGAGRDS